MTLDTIKELLGAEILCGQHDPDIDIKYAKASDLMSDVLAFSQPVTARDTVLITGLTNKQVIRTCEIAGICAIIFVRGKNPPDETIELARTCEIPVLITRLKMFETCGLLYTHGVQSISVRKSE